MDLIGFLRIQARANRLANHRLHAAMAPLTREEFHAPRTSFFPSLAATLNHILENDLYYLAALHGEADMVEVWKTFVPKQTVAELAGAQARSDQRFIALMDSLSAEQLDDVIDLVRTRHVQRERRGHVIAHLLNHQVHHRGQAHAMLAGTSVQPPQLDEFLMPSEAHFRVADMAATGWTEGDLFG
jgi:uncharacterized damage-inducible protein DinB